MAVAPWWVRERHERQWRARRHIAEEVTRAQDVRDVLRVCTGYGMGEASAPPFPAWLAIPGDLDALDAKLAHVQALVGRYLADGATPANGG